MKIYQDKNKKGFSLVELLAVIAIIGILAGIIYANFGDAKGASRDGVRQSDLKQLQLAIELYKAQNGSYPNPGCGTAKGSFTPNNPASCSGGIYIQGLVPDYITKLPVDPKDANLYQYKTNATNSEYKVVSLKVEKKLIANWSDEFARCPGQCSGSGCTSMCRSSNPPGYHYAVYKGSAAQNW